MRAKDYNLSKLFKNELKPTSKKEKRPIIIGALVVILMLLIVINPFGISFKREILAVDRRSPKTVIELGKIGLVLPFAIKNKSRVNLLFLGVGGESNPAPELTDTIILINSDSKGANPIGISIPRDLLVTPPGKNYYTKINALYQDIGIEEIKAEILEITGLEIDYYLVLDLEGVKKLVDKVGGIDVNVEKDIYDPQFPGQYNSYEIFLLKKGLQHLDGETALKYIRTRHQPEGDFSRIKRQQQVIGALKNKILSLNFIWDFPKILSLWRILENNAFTNIGLTDIKYAWNLAKRSDLDEIDFNTITSPLVVSGSVILGSEMASVLVPRSGLNNYEEIKEYINNLISK